MPPGEIPVEELQLLRFRSRAANVLNARMGVMYQGERHSLVDVRTEKEGLAGGLLVAPVLLFVVTLLMAETVKRAKLPTRGGAL